ncbi:MAG: hypothetical protein NXI24_12130 [bacterium]|nr:hypothetical protein [bacterium]
MPTKHVSNPDSTRENLIKANLIKAKAIQASPIKAVHGRANRRLIAAGALGAVLFLIAGGCRLPGEARNAGDKTQQPGPVAQPATNAPAQGRPLSEAHLADLFACMLQRVKTDWMFDQQARPVLDFRGKSIGLFLGGAQTVRHDSRFLICAGELSGTNERERKKYRERYRDDDLKRDRDPPRLRYGGYLHAIAELAGLPLYQERPASQKENADEANYINPDLIRWAEANLIPASDARIRGTVRYQMVYDRVLIRSARILARTYLYLLEENRFEKMTAEYAAGDHWSRATMRGRFADANIDDDYSNDRYDLNFDAGHAGTFWLRRGMDGTADLVWSLVVAALRDFDPEMHAEIKARQPGDTASLPSVR